MYLLSTPSICRTSFLILVLICFTFYNLTEKFVKVAWKVEALLAVEIWVNASGSRMLKLQKASLTCERELPPSHCTLFKNSSANYKVGFVKKKKNK